MSAFGQSFENTAADTYAKELRRWVSVIVAKERAWLEDRLRELKPGETWCHHEAVSDHADFGVWTRRLSGHTLPPGMHCAISGPRTQYGPAPEPWPPQGVREISPLWDGTSGDEIRAWVRVPGRANVHWSGMGYELLFTREPGARYEPLEYGARLERVRGIGIFTLAPVRECVGELHVTPHVGCILR